MKKIIQFSLATLIATLQFFTVAADNTVGFVVIKSNPPGAYVYINGENTGLKTPFQKSYDAGDYNFKLVMLDYDDFTGNFTIKQGETIQIYGKLIPSYGRADIHFTPAKNVSINIDGETTEQHSPYFLYRLKHGTHTITLNKNHFDEYSQEFNVIRGKTTTLNINMIPDHGGLNVSTSPEINADIIIDGKPPKHSSPCFINYLEAGDHTITLNRKDFEEHYQTFAVSNGENTELKIKMTPSFGGIKISTTPEINARIIIDGKEIESTTPFFLGNLSSGQHSIILSKNSYETHKQTFNVLKGKSGNLRITMKPMFSYITIKVQPEGEIFINDELQTINRFSGRLLSGTYTIEARNPPNYYSQIKQVEIIAGESKNISFELKPKTGTLSVMVDPIETNIYLNGKLHGKAPKFISKLTTGTYTLLLQKEGYKTFEKQILISDDETLEINETLVEGTSSYSKQRKEYGIHNTGDESGKYGMDSVNCITKLSLYREFYKQWKQSRYKNNSIYDALGNWEWVFNNCPKATENIYIDGVRMISYKIRKENNAALKEDMINKLMLIYDQRIQFFPISQTTGRTQVGKILGRKGTSLYTIDPSRYAETYIILKESIELEQENASAQSIIYYFRSTIKMAKLDDTDESFIKDTYLNLMGIIDTNLDKYPKNSGKWDSWQATKGNINETLKSSIN